MYQRDSTYIMTTKEGMPRLLGRTHLLLPRRALPLTLTPRAHRPLVGGQGPRRRRGPHRRVHADPAHRGTLEALDGGRRGCGQVRVFVSVSPFAVSVRLTGAQRCRELLEGLHKVGFRTHLGPNGSGFLAMARRRGGGYNLGACLLLWVVAGLELTGGQTWARHR